MSSSTDTFEDLAVVVAGSDGVLAVMDWEDFTRKYAIEYRKAHHEDLNPELAPIVGHAIYGKEPGDDELFPLRLSHGEGGRKVNVTVEKQLPAGMWIPYRRSDEKSVDFEFNLEGKR